MDTVSTVDLAATPVTLKAIGVDADGRPISLAGKNPTWAFDPADIVEVNLSEDWTQAVLTRKTAGTVTVTVSVGGIQSPPLSMQVHEPELAGVAIQVATDVVSAPANTATQGSTATDAAAQGAAPASQVSQGNAAPDAASQGNTPPSAAAAQGG